MALLPLAARPHPAMLRFIEQYQEEYAALLFMNFYFSQTVLGSVIAPQKTILIRWSIPTRTSIWALNAPMFTRVRHIAFNTEAERHAARRIFGTSLAPDSLVGCGIEQDDGRRLGIRSGPATIFRALCPLSGRVTPSKLNDLIPCFLDYCRRYGSDTKLVLTEASTRRRAKRSTRRSSARGLSARDAEGGDLHHATVAG